MPYLTPTDVFAWSPTVPGTNPFPPMSHHIACSDTPLETTIYYLYQIQPIYLILISFFLKVEMSESHKQLFLPISVSSIDWVGVAEGSFGLKETSVNACLSYLLISYNTGIFVQIIRTLLQTIPF